MQPIPRVVFWASSSLMGPRLALWEPVLYVVLQGAKRLTSGERVFEYGVGSFLLGSLHVPVLCEVVEASAVEKLTGKKPQSIREFIAGNREASLAPPKAPPARA
jgi:hypothetical protein